MGSVAEAIVLISVNFFDILTNVSGLEMFLEMGSHLAAGLRRPFVDPVPGGKGVGLGSSRVE